MTLQDWSNAATALTLPIGLVAVIVALISQRQTVHVARGDFLIRLRDAIQTHNEVHLALRPGGKWSNGHSCPQSAEEWAKIDAYMGFFETCEILMQRGALDQSDFTSSFGYRVSNILANKDVVQAKLVNERQYWLKFIKAAKRCGWSENNK